jgi:hypothetical protein
MYGYPQNHKMFSPWTPTLARLTLRIFSHPFSLTQTMPFTELAIPKLKAGLDIKVAFASQWPISAKILASQPRITNAFLGTVISENEISTERENKPIIVIGTRGLFAFCSTMLTWPLEWTEEAAFDSFLSSDDFTAFTSPIKPLAAGPAELQLFDTDLGPSQVMSAPLAEIFRLQLKDDENSIAVAKNAWKELVNTISSCVPVICGTSLNLQERVFIGAIGWKSLEVCGHKRTLMSIAEYF